MCSIGMLMPHVDIACTTATIGRQRVEMARLLIPLMAIV
jgi:hypothetical protein